MTRREFLKSLARLLISGGLVWWTARLVGFYRPNPKRSDSCTANGVCRQCPARSNCGHPTAISFREASK